jgi:hypothetical protein
MSCGVFEILIVTTNSYLRPLCRRTGIVHVRKAGAIPERKITDTCYAVEDNDARKAGAIIERSIADT